MSGTAHLIISHPFSYREFICFNVASISEVGVFVMDCIDTAEFPPICILPI